MNVRIPYLDRLLALQAEAAARLRPVYPPVALEVDHEGLLLVRLKGRRRGPPLLEAHATRALAEPCIPASIFQAPPPAGTELPLALRELFERTGTRPGRVSLVLPDNLAKITLLPLPERPASLRQLDELVRTKTRRSVPFRIDEASLSYQVLPADGNGVNVLVAVARRALVERFETALVPLGARVGLVDLATPNLLNLLRTRLDRECADGRDVALLNCAFNHFSLVILRRSQLIFFRCKTLSLEHEPAAPPNGELTREVASSLSYYREKLNGEGIGTVLVRAVGASAGEVAERLRALDVGAVAPIEPGAAVELPAARPVDPALLHRMAPALGAAAGRAG